MEKVIAEKKVPFGVLLKCLLCSYIVTAVLLLLLTLVLYKIGISEQTVSVAIVAIYVLATFVGGFIAGKLLQSRKFLWGLLLGVAYFLILVIVSLVVNGEAAEIGNSFVTTLALCAGGGMLGGMLG